MAHLGVTKTHSRPHVSNDNPISESQFKTLKCRPDFPERFGCLADVRTWDHAFFASWMFGPQGTIHRVCLTATGAALGRPRERSTR